MSSVEEFVRTASLSGIICDRWELGECNPLDPKHKEGEILKDMVLLRGTLAMLVGPAGRGKTSLLWCIAFCAVLGLERFGLRFARKCKVVIIQGENEQWDIGRLRNQLFEYFKIQRNSPEWDMLLRNIIVYRVQGASGDAFVRIARDACIRDQPDLLLIDPALEYIGGDTNTSEAVGQFLRRELRPICTEFKCACWIIHHTAKPPRGGPGRSWLRHTDLTYAGLGSVEFGNAPRVTFTLEETDEPGLFTFGVNKKIMEIGWKDAEGKPTGTRWLRHSTDGVSLMWKEVDLTEVKLKREGKRAEAEAWLDELVPTEGGVKMSTLIDSLRERGVSARLSRKIIDDRIQDKTLAREMRQTGAGTGKGRQPQAWITIRTQDVE